MGNAFADGMVLVLSFWDDYAVNMLWLDSDYPTTGTAPGDKRGTCATSSGVPKTVEAQSPNAQVIYSNIRVGPLGSTTGSQPGGTPSGTPSGTPTGTTTGSAPGATQSVYGQCGGIGYSGPTACASGLTCEASSQYYSQCLP
ncbi:hypothetical protein BT96DRAFT_926785 [Gymnopus androsaceus JB14]|uniref:Glucanase n=1 Tax=Gymnopus androsaceus JB14 TaxID=1447944 RepID=A0A6A4GUZ9_9AGAR|nr:hypothetical protein BT96DRAFT_926785 [Gymnopus androsaceus JB14]